MKILRGLLAQYWQDGHFWRTLFGFQETIEHTDAVTESTQTSPDLLSSHQLELIASALNSRGAGRPCHRCGATNWNLENGLAMQTVQAATPGMILGGPSMPLAVVVCTRCGVVNFHALGALGLLKHPAFDL